MDLWDFFLFPLKSQHNEKGNVATFKSIQEGFDWLIRGPVFAGWGLVRGIFYLIGVGFGRCDLRFTAHLVALRSMLPFSSLNGEGHSKIVKLGVENSAWLPTLRSVLVFQNWLLLTLFSLKHWKVGQLLKWCCVVRGALRCENFTVKWYALVFS